MPVLKNLFLLLATLYGALILLIFGVFLPIALYIKLPIKKFLHAVSEPVLLAFATASSEAALPHAMKALENATNATEQAQAVNDALSAAFTAIAYFEFELRKLGPLPGGGNN